MNHNIIHYTGTASLIIQVIATIIDTFVLTIATDPKNQEIKKLLAIENVVNIVELTFYVWMVTNFKTIQNITKYRYYDWALTTPTMLFTYSMYMLINQKKDNGEAHDLWTLVMNEKYILAGIFLLDWSMLYFGYMSETGEMDTKIAVFLGFIPFVLMFYVIYENYAKHTSIGNQTFIYFAVVWGLYGFAALMSYKAKNVLYNILDLFSKNFFALFLAYMVVFR